MNDPRRRMRGVKIHRDVNWNYSFCRPSHWYRYDLQDQYGFIYSPEQDPRTGFYIAVKDLSDVLDSPVAENDLPGLREGLLAGLAQLPDCEIISEQPVTKEGAIGLEVVLTFTIDGETAKRTQRLLYKDRQQFTVYGQGVPVSEYEVFHDSFQFIYMTFTFGDIIADAMGIHLPPSISVQWQGEVDGIDTMPKRPRRA